MKEKKRKSNRTPQEAINDEHDRLVEQQRKGFAERLVRQKALLQKMADDAKPLLDLIGLTADVPDAVINGKVGLHIHDQRHRHIGIYAEQIPTLVGTPVVDKIVPPNQFVSVDDGFHILDLIEEFAMAFNKLGLSIDTKSMPRRVVISDGTFDMVVHYRGLMQFVMNHILHKMFANVPPKNMRLEELYCELDPAEIRAITLAQRPLTQEALHDKHGRTNIPPNEWIDSPHVATMQAEIEREIGRQAEYKEQQRHVEK